jgi:hypothetical protein
MTWPPNAFVTGDDLLILEPGEAVTHTWGIRVLNGGDRPARGEQLPLLLRPASRSGKREAR